jgi:hypothetical protein
MAKWTEEEAVSLFLGLNPEYTANDDRISYGQTELYAEKYFSLRKLACRATDQKQVGHPYTPARWLAWAKECDIPVPPALEAEIVKWDGASGSAVSADRARIAKLQAKIAELTAAADERPRNSKISRRLSGRVSARAC